MRHLLLLLFLLTLLHATTIYGDIYNADDFESLANVVIKISGPVSIQLVVEDDNYSLELPAGSYQLQAFYYENNSLIYYSYAKLNVANETDRMHFDIVLFRPEMFEVLYEPYEEMPAYEKDDGPATPEQNQQDSNYPFFIALVSLFLLSAAAALLFNMLKSKKRPEGAPGEAAFDEQKDGFALDDDGKKVVALLEANEGRMLQRELRKQLGFSETKMSLLLDELEFNKIIKRIKKGRGNIVKILKRD